MTRFVLINEGKAAPLTAEVTQAWLEQVASACEVQLNRDVATYWGGAYQVRAGSGPTDVQPSEIVFALVDELPDAPGAIAYHDVQGNAAPFALLALSTCSTLSDVSTAVSHELCETAGDVFCNAWRDDGQGAEWAQELCDAVEADSYDVQGVMVSDFLLPAFFAAGSPGPFRYLAATGQKEDLPGPFSTATGGYQIRRDSGGGESQVNGTVRAHRAAHKRHPSSRTYRRGARV